ncbi:hypothetical protein ScPMuIL_015406 [Solemya velum]
MASALLNLGRSLPKLKNVCSSTLVRILSQHEKHFHLQSILGAEKIIMPSLSPTMETGTIVKWHKKEGESIKAGDLLCDVQTDKAVVSMDTEEEGVLAKILVPENTPDIAVGRMIAVYVEEGDDWQNVEIPAHEDPVVRSQDTSEEPVTVETVVRETTPTADTSHIDFHSLSVGPSVRKLLEEYNIPPSDVSPSGPHSRLLKGDVLKYIKSNNLEKKELKAEDIMVPKSPVTEAVTSAPPPLPLLEGYPFTDLENSNMRKIIAKRLTESKTTIPHSYAVIDSNMGAIVQMRKQLASDGIKVSVNDFIIKAVAIALQRVPQVNSIWHGDGAQMVSTVDVSVAVATENGLITPIVKNAAYLGLDEISSTVRDLAARAREGKLQPLEFQGGTFTVSNLGMFGISEFSAVINPPQAAIMALGTNRVIIDEDGRPQTRMASTLSYDARIVDDLQASMFLDVYREVMENPDFMLSGSKLSTLLREQL